MAVKKQAIPSHVDFNDERVRDFLKGGAPVLEDVLEEERRLEQERIKEELNKQLEEKTRKIAEEEAKKVLEEALLKSQAEAELKEEEESKLQLISMRIPVKLLKEIDECTHKNYTNRTAWMIEASLEKLKETQ